MAENFLSYTEADPNSQITVAADRVTWTSLSIDTQDKGLRKDFGVGAFPGDFTLEWTYKQDTHGNAPANPHYGMLALTAVNGGEYWIDVSWNKIGVGLVGDGETVVYLKEVYGGTGYDSSSYSLATTAPYYMRLTRVGTALTLTVYSDSARTNLLATLSLTLHAAVSYRSVWALQGEHASLTSSARSAYIEDLELVSGFSHDSTVTTQAVSSIADTTTTGNGTVVAVGVPAATNYGHVFSLKSTNSNPLIGGTGVTNVAKGSAPSVGAYTSAFTGLTPNSIYVNKASISQASGVTTYGDAVEFTTTGLTAPSVTTQACTSVTANDAIGNGNVVSAGGYTISARGHVWSTIPMSGLPSTVLPSSTYAEEASGATGAFTRVITPLLVNTGYYVRAYVLTSAGLYFFGSEVALTTSGGLPIVTTQLTTTITTTTATGHLTLVNPGGSNITQYGVCWKTSTGPTIADSLTQEGAYSVTPWPVAGVKRTSAISGLLPNTLYYLKAYATNTTGTAYGVEVTFTTKITGAPTVTTDDIFAMTYTTATYRGTIVDLGASAVTSHGFYRGTSASPTVADTTILDNGSEVIGQYSSDDTGLTAGTTYYFRAYAINTQGTAYGDNIEFVAGTPTAGSITYFNPANQYSRVSSIVRRFYSGLGGVAVYEAVLLLGGTSVTYVPPVGERETQSAAEPTPSPSGAGLSQADYEKWLTQVDIVYLLKRFGHFPTYSEWVAFIIDWRRSAR